MSRENELRRQMAEAAVQVRESHERYERLRLELCEEIGRHPSGEPLTAESFIPGLRH